jgi:hypothetical protein
LWQLVGTLCRPAWVPWVWAEPPSQIFVQIEVFLLSQVCPGVPQGWNTSFFKSCPGCFTPCLSVDRCHEVCAVVHATAWCVSGPVACLVMVSPHTQVKLLHLPSILPHVQAVAGLLMDRLPLTVGGWWCPPCAPLQHHQGQGAAVLLPVSVGWVCTSPCRC